MTEREQGPRCQFVTVAPLTIDKHIGAKFAGNRVDIDW